MKINIDPLKKIWSAMRRIEKISFVSASVVLCVAGAMILIFHYYATTVAVPEHGGTYREGMVGQPVFINPLLPSTEADRDIATLIFSPLSSIAESITHTDDGKIWTVRIKENLLWRDKKPITTDDILFTVGLVQNPEAHSPLYPSFQGVVAERVSEREVRFLLQNSYAFFDVEQLAALSILPKHIFGAIPAGNIRIVIDGLRPVGSGAFFVDSYTIDEDTRIITSLTLKANKLSVTGEPYIDTFIIVFFKNQTELVAAYNNGKIDGFGTNTVDPMLAVTARNNAYFLPTSRYYALFINQTKMPALVKDVSVRAALSKLIDRNQIIKTAFNGHATAFFGPLATIEDSANDSLDANAVIASALAKNKQANASLTIITPQEPFLEKTATIIAGAWSGAGIPTTVQAMSLSDIQDKALKNNNYEIILFGNITKENQDLFSFWHSSRETYPDQNLSRYNNARVDSWLEAYRQTFDQTNRLTLLDKIGKQIAADFPAIFLYAPKYAYFATPNLNGFDSAKIINISSDRFATVGSWYLKTKRVPVVPEKLPTFLDNSKEIKEIPSGYLDQFNEAIHTAETQGK